MTVPYTLKAKWLYSAYIDGEYRHEPREGIVYSIDAGAGKAAIHIGNDLVVVPLENLTVEPLPPQIIAEILAVAERKQRAEGARAIRIEDLELSVRSLNALAKANMITIGDLTRYTRRQLRTLDNLGARSVNEITDLLRDFGIRLNP